MTTLEPNAGFNLFLMRNFLDARTCEMILSEMRSAQSGPATVYRGVASGVVDERVRKATRVVPSPETSVFVRRMLLERKGAVEEHFKLSLSDCEDPQFLRYGVGDFFVAHQDGNTPLLQFDRERVRRVSVIIFLNSQSESPDEGDYYCGGSLVFHGWGAGVGRAGDRRLDLRGEAGTLVAFPPETTHEVAPVTHGERHSIACWYR